MRPYFYLRKYRSQTQIGYSEGTGNTAVGLLLQILSQKRVSSIISGACALAFSFGSTCRLRLFQSFQQSCRLLMSTNPLLAPEIVTISRAAPLARSQPRGFQSQLPSPQTSSECWSSSAYGSPSPPAAGNGCAQCSRLAPRPPVCTQKSRSRACCRPAPSRMVCQRTGSATGLAAAQQTSTCHFGVCMAQLPSTLPLPPACAMGTCRTLFPRAPTTWCLTTKLTSAVTCRLRINALPKASNSSRWSSSAGAAGGLQLPKRGRLWPQPSRRKQANLSQLKPAGSMRRLQ